MARGIDGTAHGYAKKMLMSQKVFIDVGEMQRHDFATVDEIASLSMKTDRQEWTHTAENTLSRKQHALADAVIAYFV